ncbi:hypothetical protein L7F22_069265 [Adiantum nelumboides]|nr:hypothetical protein [Adiantum nelumboides]
MRLITITTSSRATRSLKPKSSSSSLDSEKTNTDKEESPREAQEEVHLEFEKSDEEGTSTPLERRGIPNTKIEPNIEVKVVEQPRILTKEPRHDQQVAHDVDTFRKEMQEVVGLMKNLSVHMMGGGRGQGYGYGRGYGSTEGFAGGRGRGMAGRGDMFQWYNCGEWGHKSPQCDKPKRMGGDMFPLASQITSRAQDYGIEIKGEARPSGLTAEEKGKTKVVNIIRLDKGKDDINAMVMPVGKRTTREQETSDAGSSHKRGKQAKTGTGKEKKKRKPRRHYNTSNFPLGEGQPNYILRADLVGRKADVTFGQLMEMCPRLKRQWKRMVNPMKNEPTKGSIRVLSLNELPDICPTIDAWHKRKCIGEAYIDGGAQFMKLLDKWVATLAIGERAPDFLKRDRFVAGFSPPLKDKVKATFPVTFEAASKVARLKERKLRYQMQHREVDQEGDGGARPPPEPQHHPSKEEVKEGNRKTITAIIAGVYEGLAMKGRYGGREEGPVGSRQDCGGQPRITGPSMSGHVKRSYQFKKAIEGKAGWGWFEAEHDVLPLEKEKRCLTSLKKWATKVAWMRKGQGHVF